MASRILAILEETARDLATHLNAYYIYKEMDFKTSRSIANYFVNSLDILYSEPLFELMKPIRQALAGILDALLPSLLRQPYFPEMLSLPSWKRWSAAIAADQVEYRTALGHYRSPTESILPSESELEALFNRVLGQYDGDEDKKDNTEKPRGKDAKKGGPEKVGEEDKGLPNRPWKKKEADIKEFNGEESTLVYQAPSVGGSTGSDADTWNSIGTDGAEAESEKPSTTSSTVYDKHMH